MKLVGFIIRIYHDARSSECQIRALKSRSVNNVATKFIPIMVKRSLALTCSVLQLCDNALEWQQSVLCCAMVKRSLALTCSVLQLCDNALEWQQPVLCCAMVKRSLALTCSVLHLCDNALEWQQPVLCCAQTGPLSHCLDNLIVLLVHPLHPRHQPGAKELHCINPYPTAFPYGNGMVLHFYQQQESSTTKTVHKVINKGLKTYV